MSRPNVFVSYSHKNSRALKSLLPYLDTLKRANFVDVWTDRQLRGGQRWREEIRAALAAAGRCRPSHLPGVSDVDVRLRRRAAEHPGAADERHAHGPAGVRQSLDGDV